MNNTRDDKQRFSRSAVWGVGINDSTIPVRKPKDPLSAYAVWSSMLLRCYNEKYQEKHKAYSGCSVCEEWHTYSNFEKWYNEHYRKGYALDKDIIKKGNKVYGPEFCSLVPREINNLIEKSSSTRGRYLIGVSAYKYGFRASISKKNKAIHIGVFKTETDAFVAYKKEKERYIKQLAQEYFLKGDISERVFNALMEYEIDAGD